MKITEANELYKRDLTFPYKPSKMTNEEFKNMTTGVLTKLNIPLEVTEKSQPRYANKAKE